MKGELIYLGRPIDLASHEQGEETWATGVYETVLDALAASGFAVYNPATAFQIGMGVDPQPWVGQINRAAMYRSAGMVALLPTGVPTLGTPIEIFEMARIGKPVAVLSDIEGSWTLTGLERRNLVTFPLSGLGVRNAVAWLENWELAPELVGMERREQIEVELLEGGVMPTQGYPGDAGYDLHVVGDHTVNGNAFIDLPCNLKLGLPRTMWGLITGRSSTLRRRGLMVVQGVIDTGYRGPIFTGVWNLGTEPVHVKDGERLAQLIPFYNEAQHTDLLPVTVLADSQRGERGFGSTGS